MLTKSLRACMVAMLALTIGLSLARDTNAVYGEPRFYESQPIITDRLIRNSPGQEFIVTGLTQGANSTQLRAMTVAITAWNDALRAAPNSLTKYPLHFNSLDDPNANIIIQFVQTLPQGCGADACNDVNYPTTRIYVKNTVMGSPLVIHELGHSLWYSDQYNADLSCSPADTIMNSNAPGCKTSITTTDMNDFNTRYNPTYVSPNPEFPDTALATWNAVYQVGNVTLKAPLSYVEWSYDWQKFTDTGGSQLSEVYTQKDVKQLDYSFGLANRYCVTDKIYNEVGFPGTQSWSPRSQYSCIGTPQQQNAGFFLATSDRNSPSSNTLYIRLKNFSGGTRNLGIFGPNFENIGCGYQNLAYQATRTCSITLSRGAYANLSWFAWDAANNLSYGYLDFE